VPHWPAAGLRPRRRFSTNCLLGLMQLAVEVWVNRGTPGTRLAKVPLNRVVVRLLVAAVPGWAGHWRSATCRLRSSREARWRSRRFDTPLTGTR